MPCLFARCLRPLAVFCIALILFQWTGLAKAIAYGVNAKQKEEEFAKQRFVVLSYELDATEKMIQAGPACRDYDEKFVHFMTALFARKLIPSETIPAPNKLSLVFEKAKKFYKPPMTADKPIATQLTGNAQKPKVITPESLNISPKLVRAINNDSRLGSMFQVVAAAAQACAPLRKALSQSESDLYDAEADLINLAFELDPQQTKGFSVEAYGFWLSSLIRRTVNLPLHTTISEISGSVQCQGDLLKDLVVPNFFTAVATGNTAFIEKQRATLLMQLSCLDQYQSVALDMALGLAQLAVQIVFTEPAEQYLRKRLTEALYLLQVPVVDTNKHLGPTPSWLSAILLGNPFIVGDDSYIVKHGVALYDRQTGKIKNYPICPEAMSEITTLSTAQSVAVEQKNYDLVTEKIAPQPGIENKFEAMKAKTLMETKTLESPDAYGWWDVKSPYGLTIKELDPVICPAKPQPAQTPEGAPKLSSRYGSKGEGTITKTREGTATSDGSGADCYRIADITDSLVANHVGFGVCGLTENLDSRLHVCKKIVCDGPPWNQPPPLPDMEDDFKPPEVKTCDMPLFQGVPVECQLAKGPSNNIYVNDVPLEGCGGTNPLAEGGEGDATGEKCHFCDFPDQEITGTPPSSSGKSSDGGEPKTPGSAGSSKPGEGGQTGGQQTQPGQGSTGVRKKPCNTSLLERVWDEYILPSAYAADGKGINSEEELLAALEKLKELYDKEEQAFKNATVEGKVLSFKVNMFGTDELEKQIEGSPFVRDYLDDVMKTALQVFGNQKFRDEVKNLFIEFMRAADPSFSPGHDFNATFDFVYGDMLPLFAKKFTSFPLRGDPRSMGMMLPSGVVEIYLLNSFRESTRKDVPFKDRLVTIAIHESLHVLFFKLSLRGYNIGKGYKLGQEVTQENMPDHKLMERLQQATTIALMGYPLKAGFNPKWIGGCMAAVTGAVSIVGGLVVSISYLAISLLFAAGGAVLFSSGVIDSINYPPHKYFPYAAGYKQYAQTLLPLPQKPKEVNKPKPPSVADSDCEPARPAPPPAPKLCDPENPMCRSPKCQPLTIQAAMAAKCAKWGGGPVFQPKGSTPIINPGNEGGGKLDPAFQGYLDCLFGGEQGLDSTCGDMDCAEGLVPTNVNGKCECKPGGKGDSKAGYRGPDDFCKMVTCGPDNSSSPCCQGMGNKAMFQKTTTKLPAAPPASRSRTPYQPPQRYK